MNTTIRNDIDDNGGYDVGEHQVRPYAMIIVDRSS